MPAHSYSCDPPMRKAPQSELDISVERNLSNFADNYRTKDDTSKNSIVNRNSSNFKSSHSMQNIYEVKNNFSINTNNEFDQNSILQPEKAHLLDDVGKITIHQKGKSEVDLKDVIGNIWTDRVETVRPDCYMHLKKANDISDGPSLSEMHSNLSEKSNNSLSFKNSNGTIKSPRNKSSNLISHLVNGSKTLPKRTKFDLERTSLNKGKSIFVSTKHIDISPSKYSFTNLAN